MTAFAGRLAPLCKAEKTKPCCARLVIRPRKVPIEETLKALQPVLKAALFGDLPPEISFEVSCPTSAVPTRAEAIKRPWGPRAPDRPCF